MPKQEDIVDQIGDGIQGTFEISPPIQKRQLNLEDPVNPLTLDDKDLDLNFDEEENGDIRQNDQLPTIFEKSHMDEDQDLKIQKYRTHVKKQSMQVGAESFMSGQFTGYMEQDAAKAYEERKLT